MKVLVDADVGIDDAIALVLLAAARPDVEVVAVGAVHGNCAGDDAAQNALRVLELCGLGDVPVALGAAQPLARALALAPHVHGRDGLGEVGFPPPRGAVTGEHAADQLLRLARERPGELDLLALGPLTNLGLALRRDPEVLLAFRSVVVMGGSGPYPRLGTLRAVDANVDHDPDAAALVFSAPRRRLVMVGVNVTMPAVLDEEAIARVAAADTPQAAFVSRILAFYLGFYRHKWGRRVCSMHDPLAAAVLLDPTLVTAATDGPVNVVGDGLASRAWLMRREDGGVPAVPAHDAPPTTVLTAVDAERFLARLVRALVEPLPG